MVCLKALKNFDKLLESSKNTKKNFWQVTRIFKEYENQPSVNATVKDLSFAKKVYL